mmetsp:Transcript_30675/g.57767  ORF Transcript_30675/g.57767 Transcript_30675/m.57767 type:complete len:418 (+) Transcript_30675:254-1507(+)
MVPRSLKVSERGTGNASSRLANAVGVGLCFFLILSCMLFAAVVALIVYPVVTEDALLEVESVSQEENSEDSILKDEYKLYSYCPNNGNPKPQPALQDLDLQLPNATNIAASNSTATVFVNQVNHKVLLKGYFALRSRSSVQMLPLSDLSVQRSYQFQSCAMVGNAGGLRWSSFGQAIDSHDVVLRLNQAPTNRQYRKFVGSKTTFRMMNRNSVSVYSTGAYMERAFPLENGVTLVVSRIPGPMFEKLNKRMKAERPDVSVLYLSSHVINLARAIMTAYRIKLCDAGHGPFLGGTAPSSGGLGVLMLMHMCQSVSVYGVGNKHENLEFPYHYFRVAGDRTSSDTAHSLYTEETFVNRLGKEHRLYVCHPRMVNSTCGGDVDTKACIEASAEVEKHNRVCGFKPQLVNTDRYIDAVQAP